jgi:DNA replication and repair protein RecF
MDVLLSQLSRVYLDDLLHYRQVLRQRNRILASAKQSGTLREDTLEPWDRSLAEYGAKIISRRGTFLSEFGTYVENAYARLMDDKESPSLHYQTASEVRSPERPEILAADLLEKMRRRRGEESRRGLSLVGPHRDEIVLRLNGVEVQKYASQGQHRTLLIALKMGEFSYLKERRGETPILLLDDVFSELDEHRAQRLLENIVHVGQTIITTTDDGKVRTSQSGNEDRVFYVEQGTCRPFRSRTDEEAAKIRTKGETTIAV